MFITNFHLCTNLTFTLACYRHLKQMSNYHTFLTSTRKTELDISFRLSLEGTVWMKCQTVFIETKEKHLKVSSLKIIMAMVNLKHERRLSKNKPYLIVFEMTNLFWECFLFCIHIDPITLRMAKTQWSFGHSECNSVNACRFQLCFLQIYCKMQGMTEPYDSVAGYRVMDKFRS